MSKLCLCEHDLAPHLILLALPRRKRVKGGGEQGEDRGSLWVTPMQWMQELSSGETQGKLYCPRCTATLTALPCC